MFESSPPTAIQRMAHSLQLLWAQRSRQGQVPEPHPSTGGEAPSSTLFMDSAFTFLPEPQSKTFKIRIARRNSVLQDALGLINRRYNQRGYGFQTLTLSPDRMTIVAYEEQQVLGTLTVQLDKHGNLLSDECFAGPLNALRSHGASLCEFTKLATAPRAPMPATLASMFHVAFIFAHQVHGATHAVVEVNPRHVTFYTRVLGFTAHGSAVPNPRVRAPGVLLVADFAHIAHQLMARHSQDSGQAAPFFSHSFSHTEEEGIRQRMQAAFQQPQEIA